MNRLYSSQYEWFCPTAKIYKTDSFLTANMHKKYYIFKKERHAFIP